MKPSLFRIQNKMWDHHGISCWILSTVTLFAWITVLVDWLCLTDCVDWLTMLVDWLCCLTDYVACLTVVLNSQCRLILCERCCLTLCDCPLCLMTVFDNSMWWPCLMTLFTLCDSTVYDDSMLWPCLMTLYDGPMWWPCMMALCDGLELCSSACLCCLCALSCFCFCCLCFLLPSCPLSDD